MLGRLLALPLIGVVGVVLIAAEPNTAFCKRRMDPDRILELGGSNAPQIHVSTAPWSSSRPSLDEYVGTTDTAGTTWCDNQHSGTCGRMISVDASGYVSVVWMKGFYADPSLTRLVYYNVWNPIAQDFVFDSTGIRIDVLQRAGYICQATNAQGFCAAAFHQIFPGNNAHAAVAFNYAPYTDAFTTTEPDWCYEGGTDLPIMFPKIAMGTNGVLHLISTEMPMVPENPMRIYYSRGVPYFDSDSFWVDIQWDAMSCGGFELWDTVTVISPDIACSRHTDRVAAAWCHPADDLFPGNNDIYLRVSEDGGANWSPPLNVTHWASQDTLRAFTDCSILFDESNYVHIAFTVSRASSSDDRAYGTSMIWHWSEETDDLSLVANGWWPEYQVDPGTWQLFVQRPSLAIDPLTDYLYCSYQQYDPETLSWAGFPLADAFVTVSSDNGRSWAVGTNVTNTTPDITPVPQGESLHERDITVVPLVTEGFLHMEYILDKDAGTSTYGEGVATLNPVIYQRIPVDQIVLGVPSTPPDLPSRFVLHPNYPNPFNPTTTLQFDLMQYDRVTLKVFNVLGQEVATLFDKAPLGAGMHRVEFDGSLLASGIYFYRLETPGFSAARKMVLLK